MEPLRPDHRLTLPAWPPAVAALDWAAVGGGFSGAAVWRGADPAGRPVAALKAWPPGAPAAHLRAVHARVARLAHIPFVPQPIPTARGDTVVFHAGRAWEAVAWIPGAPDADPSPARREAAAAALAAVHAGWPSPPHFAPCPAVARRLRALADWDADPPPLPAPLADAVRRARAAVRPLVPAARAELAAWADRPVRLRPCAGDVWPAHVLFTGAAVTGLIDFGAAKDDHTAADLARLFGGYPGGRAGVAAGVAAYRAAGGDPVPDELTQLLAWTGALGAAAAWVRRLAAGDAVSNVAVVAVRLNELLDRLAELTS